MKHIARHLERMAMFAIPCLYDLDGQGDDMSFHSDKPLHSAGSPKASSNDDLNDDSSGSMYTGAVDSDADNSIDEEEVEPDTEGYIIDPLELPTAPEEIVAVNLPCYQFKPYRKNQDFVGRNTVKSQIAEAFSSSGPREYRKIFVLCGSGGVGKTQAALSYVFDHMEEFQAVLWAHASSQTRILDSFTRFAVDLGLVPSEDEGVKDPTSSAEILMRWLNTTGMIHIYEEALRLILLRCALAAGS
jgi:hypothetical protein